MSSIENLGMGRMSLFGGPADRGVGPHEGLALVEPADLEGWWFGSLFLPAAPSGTTGLARRLDPQAFYVAMRWDYGRHPRELLRRTMVILTNPSGGRWVMARPVDFGPGDGGVVDGKPTPDTGRLADLSPGAAGALGLGTDDLVRCELVC